MVRNVRYLTAIVCFSLINSVFANTLSPDLKDLKKRWDEIQKEENHDLYLSLSVEMFEEDTSLHDSRIFKKELDELELQNDSKVKNIAFLKLENNAVRKAIIKNLFASRDGKYDFCRAYPTVELKLARENSEMTDIDRMKLQDRANLNSCKRLTESMLGGILYANPNVYLFDSDFSNKEGESHVVVIYVRSIIDNQQYLRYRFKLSH